MKWKIMQGKTRKHVLMLPRSQEGKANEYCPQTILTYSYEARGREGREERKKSKTQKKGNGEGKEKTTTV